MTIDISPEAVKAFVSANADVTDPVQRRLLDMLTALSAERVRLLQEAFDNAQDAYHTGVERDAQTKRANEGWQNALDNANEIYRIRQERDTIKATVARLCEAAEDVATLASPHFTDSIQELALTILSAAIAAARETLK